MKKYNIIDIGSAGLLSEPWATYPEYVGDVLKFEPRDSEEQLRGVRFLPYALWSESVERDFYIYRGFDGTGSSLFRQNYAYVAANFPMLKQRGDRRLAETWFERSGEVRRERLMCRTLDSVIGEMREGGDTTQYHFLKVDAQGADFEILQGAQEYLRRDCFGLQCELFTLPLYEGIALLDDVEKWLDDRGFRLWHKNSPHGTFHSQHDCVFIKNGADTSFLTQVLGSPARRPSLYSRVKQRVGGAIRRNSR